MKRLAHVCAAILLFYALTVTYATPAFVPLPTAAPGAVACVSPDLVAGRMGGMKPSLDLQGLALKAWNANFKAVSGLDAPPEVDRIVIYGMLDNSEGDTKVLFITFSHGCMQGGSVINQSTVLKILSGGKV